MENNWRSHLSPCAEVNVCLSPPYTEAHVHMCSPHTCAHVPVDTHTHIQTHKEKTINKWLSPLWENWMGTPVPESNHVRETVRRLSGLVAHTCNIRTRETEAGGSGVQRKSDYAVRLCLRKAKQASKPSNKQQVGNDKGSVKFEFQINDNFWKWVKGFNRPKHSKKQCWQILTSALPSPAKPLDYVLKDNHQGLSLYLATSKVQLSKHQGSAIKIHCLTTLG